MPRNLHLGLLLGLSLFLFSGGAIVPDDDAAVEPTLPPAATVRNQQAATDDDPDLAEFVTFVEESMARDHIPGVAVAVVRGSEPLLLKGFGWRDVARQQPVTPDTLFHIGSTQWAGRPASPAASPSFPTKVHSTTTSASSVCCQSMIWALSS